MSQYMKLGAFSDARGYFFRAIFLVVMSMVVNAQALAETLKISHFLPSHHGFQVDVLEPLAKELRENAGIETEIYSAGSVYGNVAKQADQVRAGVVDIAIGLRGIPRGRFLASSVIELPFVVQDAGSGSKALWQLYKDGSLGDEYSDFIVLGLYTHHGGLIHTRNKPVETLEDLKGLRLRTPSPVVSEMLKSQKASPVGMPPSQIYENLQKGVIDGLVTTWDLVNAVKANELLKYHTDARAYAASFYIVMNKKKYESLSVKAKKVLDSMTGDQLVEKIGPLWDKWEQRGYDDAKKRGNTIIEVPEKNREEWKKSMQPMIQVYLDGLKQRGVKDPQALYKKTISLVEKFEKDSKK